MLSLGLSLSFLLFTFIHARDGLRCSTSKPFNVIYRFCLCSPCDFCVPHFSGCSYECRPKLVNSSDGADIIPKQPVLDPTIWFLTQQEITTARNGVPRDGLSTFTTGNKVYPLIDAADAYTEILRDIQKTGSHPNRKDFVYFTSWCLADVYFNPYNKSTQVSTVWNDTVQRNVDVLALAWSNIGIQQKGTLKLHDYIKYNISTPQGTISKMILDDRVKGRFHLGSIHQKTYMIKHEDFVSYIGGIDLCYDRWTTLSKFEAIRYKLAPHDPVGRDGWVDEAVKIIGPASLDIFTNFQQRWDDVSPASKWDPKYDRFFGHTNFAHQNTDFVRHVIPNRVNTVNGTASVQITRTYRCRYKGFENFAPKGETTILASRLKAIQHARNYIFIQDQYFLYMKEFVDVLLSALSRIQKLILVIQPCLRYYPWIGYQAHQHRFIRKLVSKYPNKIHIYRYRDNGLYVHSKLMIIDDVFVSIGSANMNYRSMTSDSEICANIVDQETITSPSDGGILVSKFARDLRIKVISESTNIPYNVLDRLSIVQMAEIMDEIALAKHGNITFFDIDRRKLDTLYKGFTQPVVDEDGRCHYETED
jgi:phosphatidylserine/phosphatidylglycerophosphate/cardiolipin synthase-like enzyme